MKHKKDSKKSHLGVDIGAHSIKILESTQESNKILISKFLVKEMPHAATDSPDLLYNSLKSASDEGGFSSREVRISLSGPDVTVRFINMPQMTEKDLKNSLKFEADKYIPFNIDEVIIDSHIIGRLSDEKGQMRVLLTAAKKDVINKRMEIFKKLDYEVTLIDLDDFSIYNAFIAAQKNVDNEKSIALMNVGHKFTNVFVYKGNEPYFTRDIQVGGCEIYKNIAKQFNVSEEESYKLMEEQGEKEIEIHEIVKSVFSNLVSEIRLSFGYYENQYGRSIEQIYISGGMIGFKGLIEYFEENLGTKPCLWDPTSNFIIGRNIEKDKFEKVKHLFAVASGLIVR